MGGWLLFTRYKEPGPDGGKVVEMESGEDCTTMYMYLMPLNYTHTNG